MAAAPRILMPREMRTEDSYSPPFYTRAPKVVFGITTVGGSGDHKFHLQQGLGGGTSWFTVYSGAVPIDWGPSDPVTRYTFHNHTFGLVSYGLYDFWVKAYLTTNQPLRVYIEHISGAALVYSVMASDCISLIQAVA
mgnify:CR=1 FL=1